MIPNMSQVYPRLLLLLLVFDAVAAFTPGSVVVTQHVRSCAIRMSTRGGSPIDGSEAGRIEEARKSFEELLRDETIAAQLYSDSTKEKTSLLTSAGLHRRGIEMSLLESLRDSDDAVDELVHFWITERDPEFAAQIFAMEEKCSEGLIEEEKQLRHMMDQHPTWAEPAIRYATLLFLKGRADEAYELALDALEMKPWHFEIPQLLIMISLRNEDMAQALYWARKALPNLRSGNRRTDENSGDAVVNRRRHQWVERALEASKKQLADAEELREELARRLTTQPLSTQTQQALEAWQ